MPSPEGFKFDKVGAWTMENADEIAHNFDLRCDCLFSWDCDCHAKFKKILAEFISLYIPEDDDPDRINHFLSHEFIRVLSRNKLRQI